MLRAFGAEVDDSDNADDLDWDWEEDGLIGRKVLVRLKSTPARKDNKTGQEYSARNEIARWLSDGEE